jgi:hypothetical protein
MRKRGLEEERNYATECVSMLVTSKSSEGAYIDLCRVVLGESRLKSVRGTFGPFGELRVETCALTRVDELVHRFSSRYHNLGTF